MRYNNEQAIEKLTKELESIQEKMSLIHAHEDGKTIQVLNCRYEWENINDPGWQWDEGCEYRIKPEPKVVWVNEYPHDHTTHKTKEKAEKFAASTVVRVAVKYVEVLDE